MRPQGPRHRRSARRCRRIGRLGYRGRCHGRLGRLGRRRGGHGREPRRRRHGRKLGVLYRWRLHRRHGLRSGPRLPRWLWVLVPNGGVDRGHVSRPLPCAVESQQSQVPDRETTQRLSGWADRGESFVPCVLSVRCLCRRQMHPEFRLLDAQPVCPGGYGRSARLQCFESHLLGRTGSRPTVRSRQVADELLRRLL